MININEKLDKLPEGLRWGLILPIAIFSFLIVELISRILLLIQIPSHFISLFTNLLGHSLFVFIGALIAPKYRFGIALGLTIIIVIISTLSIFFIIKDYLMIEDIVPSEEKDLINSMKGIIEIEMIGKILAILGSGYVTLLIRKFEEKLDNI
ncbi:MAG: hypothetical protein ACOC1O_04405 [bacterium]